MIWIWYSKHQHHTGMVTETTFSAFDSPGTSFFPKLPSTSTFDAFDDNFVGPAGQKRNVFGEEKNNQHDYTVFHFENISIMQLVTSR